VYRDTVAIFVAFAVLFLMAAFVEVPLERIADPNDKSFVPRPEWYFMALFQTLKLFEGQWEMVGAIILPGVAVTLLILVPFLDRQELKSLRNRTVAIGVISFAMIGWTSLTVAGLMSTPEGAVTVAADAGAMTDSHWAELSPQALTGLAYFRENRCSNCHNLLSGEPKAGPTLATLSNKAPSNFETHLKQIASQGGIPEIHLDSQAMAALAAFVSELTPENSLHLGSVPESIINGARVYEKSQCGMCHQINGRGMSVGPPLNGVGSRHSADWLKSKVKDPKAGSPTTLMPPFDLPPHELNQLAAYLTALP
jgi:ubiquinol-cytochrome c reductase cytochrome b subunit